MERIVGQTNGTQQLCPLGNILPRFHIGGVHGVTAGDEGDNPAGANLVNGLGKEIVVDRKSQLVIGTVIDLVVPEGHIADGKIKEIPAICGFKACHGNLCVGIKLLCNSTGNTV